MSNDRPWETAEFPRAIYGCHTDSDACEMAYIPQMLRWYRDGWYCDDCLEDCDEDEIGNTLAHEIMMRKDNP